MKKDVSGVACKIRVQKRTRLTVKGKIVGRAQGTTGGCAVEPLCEVLFDVGVDREGIKTAKTEERNTIRNFITDTSILAQDVAQF